MPYTTAFPDFPPSSMPCIPDTWEDTSWHLDAAPSFTTPQGHTVWVDYEDASLREHPTDSHRFCVVDRHGEELISTDDWTEVLCVVLG